MAFCVSLVALYVPPAKKTGLGTRLLHLLIPSSCKWFHVVDRPNFFFIIFFAVPCSLAKNWDQLVASFLDPAQLSVAFSTASDGKLGGGLGTRLASCKGAIKNDVIMRSCQLALS